VQRVKEEMLILTIGSTEHITQLRAEANYDSH
jgi:hypothetical protein